MPNHIYKKALFLHIPKNISFWSSYYKQQYYSMCKLLDTITQILWILHKVILNVNY